MGFGHVVRSADDADWPAMARLAAVCFGSLRSPEVNDTWRTTVAADGAIIVCDGPEIVGMSLSLDLRLTVPGGVVRGRRAPPNSATASEPGSPARQHSLSSCKQSLEVRKSHRQDAQVTARMSSTASVIWYR